MNRDGSLSQLRIDNSSHNLGAVHYCGQAVGQRGYHNPCGFCDGRCGPKSGCQCRACHALDEEIASRKHKMASLTGQTDPVSSFVNAEGAECQVSYCPEARNGHFTAGYKFYCSRRVGREGYAQRHPDCDCDGICGPNHGCQCRACYELDQSLSTIAPITSPIPTISAAPDPAHSCTNRDNAKCHLSMDDLHQFRNVHYCGRFVGHYGYFGPCGRCDGRCGPGNGCQCEACHALDEEIATRKRALALADGLTPAQSPFVNGEGVECHVSYSPPADNGHFAAGYKFYCSRRAVPWGYAEHHSDCNCDGRCGPNNGCQCRACYELDQRVESLRSSLVEAETISEPTPVTPLPHVIVEAPTPSSLPSAASSEPTPEPARVSPPPSSPSLPSSVDDKIEEPSLPSAAPSSSDDLLCVVCFEAPKCVAIIPCGHLSMCQSCFNTINSMPNKRCPLCKGNILSHLKVFI